MKLHSNVGEDLLNEYSFERISEEKTKSGIMCVYDKRCEICSITILAINIL